MTKQCPRCQTTNQIGTKFCVNCGLNLETAMSQPPVVTPGPVPPNPGPLTQPTPPPYYDRTVVVDRAKPGGNNKTILVAALAGVAVVAVGVIILAAILINDGNSKNATATAQAQALAAAATATSGFQTVQAQTATAQAQATLAEAQTVTAQAQATLDARNQLQGQTATAQAAILAQTATARAQLTARVQTVTAIARSTVTAGAVREATVAAGIRATAAALQAKSRVFHTVPEGIKIANKENNLVKSELLKKSDQNITLNNFIIEAAFVNPFEGGEQGRDWTYGFRFRASSSASYYLFVSSQKDWFLRTSESGTWTTINRFTRPLNLRTEAGEINRLKLYVNNTTGLFYVNGEPIATLDLSKYNVSGTIGVAIGFFEKSEIEGKVTEVKDITLSTIDP